MCLFDGYCIFSGPSKSDEQNGFTPFLEELGEPRKSLRDVIESAINFFRANRGSCEGISSSGSYAEMILCSRFCVKK